MRFDKQAALEDLEKDKRLLKEEFKHTKQNLKTMSKNGNAHKLRTSSRIFKYGAISFTRNIWLSVASIMVMTVTLIVLFVTIVASQILVATADGINEKVDITIFFKPGVSETTLSQMKSTIQGNSNVKSVSTHTSEEEFNIILEENADDRDLISIMEAAREETIAMTPATMTIKVYDVNKIDSIKTTIESDRTFIANLSEDPDRQPTYDSNSAEIETINSWANIAKYGGAVLSLIFFFISILVIFNTIRMAIFSRREEIYMMRLIGADNNFIRGPFLIEAQISGVISGIVAAITGSHLFNIVSQGLDDYGINVTTINNLLHSEKLVLVYAVFIAVGIAIGTLSASLAIRKYLRNRKRHNNKRSSRRSK